MVRSHGVGPGQVIGVSLLLVVAVAVGFALGMTRPRRVTVVHHRTDNHRPDDHPTDDRPLGSRP